MGCRITILKARKLAEIANDSSFACSAMTIGTVEHRYEISGYTENGSYYENRDETLLPAPLGRRFDLECFLSPWLGAPLDLSLKFRFRPMNGKRHGRIVAACHCSRVPCDKPLRMLLLHFPRRLTTRAGRGTPMGVEAGGGLAFDPE
jgi:hypothetical protein